MISEILSRQYFIGQGHYSKVKLRSYHDVAHLQSQINVPTKHQLPTPYGFRDIAQTRFYRPRSLWQGQRSNQGHTMMFLRYRPDKYFQPKHPSGHHG